MRNIKLAKYVKMNFRTEPNKKIKQKHHNYNPFKGILQACWC